MSPCGHCRRFGALSIRGARRARFAGLIQIKSQVVIGITGTTFSANKVPGNRFDNFLVHAPVAVVGMRALLVSSGVWCLQVKKINSDCRQLREVAIAPTTSHRTRRRNLTVRYLCGVGHGMCEASLEPPAAIMERS